MKRNYNELAAVVYADLFGYPLTVKEAKLWAIRIDREKLSHQKEVVALKISRMLQKVPTIEAVFLTGSVAVYNAKRGADIDLMIITKPNTLWLTRLVIFPWLKKRVCPNLFLDSRHLKIKSQNLFTAHEVLQAKCLYDRDGIEAKWLKENVWTERYLPNAYKSRLLKLTAKNRNFRQKALLSFLLAPFEFVAYVFQYLYQKPKQTNESLGWGYAFFHPKSLSSPIERKFEKRLLKYMDR